MRQTSRSGSLLNSLRANYLFHGSLLDCTHGFIAFPHLTRWCSKTLENIAKTLLDCTPALLFFQISLADAHTHTHTRTPGIIAFPTEISLTDARTQSSYWGFHAVQQTHLCIKWPPFYTVWKRCLFVCLSSPLFLLRFVSCLACR